VQEQANFWICYGFLPKFPQTCPNNFGVMTTVFGMTSKKWSSCDSLYVGHHFFKSKHVGHHFVCIIREFAQILSIYSPNQKVWGCACTPASYITVLLLGLTTWHVRGAVLPYKPEVWRVLWHLRCFKVRVHLQPSVSHLGRGRV